MLRLLSLLSASSLACDSQRAPAPHDAGLEDAALEAGLEIAEPAPPAPPAPATRPALAPCAAGWREVPDTDWPEVSTCDPWPEGGRRVCDGASAHFPGEAECARIGSPCAADGWPTDLPGERTIHYVDAAEPVDGDGSLAAPHRSIASALQAAGDGDVVAVAAGRYVEAVEISHAVTLWGACAERTILVPPDDAVPGVVVYDRGGTILRDLTVDGGRVGIALFETDERISIERVVVRGARADGVDVNGATVDLVDVAVRDIGAPGVDSRGISVFGGGDATLHRVVVERPGTFGLRVDEGSTLRGTGISVGLTSDGGLAPDQYPGDGVVVAGGGRLELVESVIHDAVRNGLIVAQASSATLQDCVVQHVEPLAAAEPDARWGTGAWAQDGSQLELERVLVESTHVCAVGAEGAGTALTATDLVTRDVTAPVRPFFVQGFGVVALVDAAAVLRRTAVVRAQGSGLFATLRGALEAEDLLVLGTRAGTSEGGTAFGDAVHVNDGARIELVGAELIDNEQGGGVASAGGRLVARDVRITTSAGAVTGAAGAPGLSVSSGIAELERVAIDGASGWGVLVLLDGTVTGTDLQIAASRPPTPGGIGGYGIVVNTVSSVELERVRVDGSRTIGVALMDASRATFVDLAIERTQDAACAPDGCAAGGVGLQVGSGAQADLRRFAIAGSALAGLQLLEGGVLALHEGRVVDNPIGANVQDLDFDTARLQDRVVWRNDRNFDASVLPVPGFEGRLAGNVDQCRRGDDEALDLDLEPIGAPTWAPRGFFQTSVRPRFGDEAMLNYLLAPNHLFGGGLMFAGAAHPPPYDQEFADAMHESGCASVAAFDAEEFTDPSWWGLFFTLVPVEGAATGSSADSPEGPILDDAVYPIEMTGALFDEDGVYDPLFESTLVGMEALDEALLDGFSHQVLWLLTNDSFGPAGSDPIGRYSLELDLRDDLGNGWHVVSRFEVR